MCQFDDIGLLTTFPDYRVPQMLRAADAAARGRAAVRSAPGGRCDAGRMLERGGTEEISIMGGTMCTVEGIVRRVREEILWGCVGGIPSAAAAAVAGGMAARGGDRRIVWTRERAGKGRRKFKNALAIYTRCAWAGGTFFPVVVLLCQFFGCGGK